MRNVFRRLTTIEKNPTHEYQTMKAELKEGRIMGLREEIYKDVEKRTITFELEDWGTGVSWLFRAFPPAHLDEFIHDDVHALVAREIARQQIIINCTSSNSERTLFQNFVDISWYARHYKSDSSLSEYAIKKKMELLNDFVTTLSPERVKEIIITVDSLQSKIRPNTSLCVREFLNISEEEKSITNPDIIQKIREIMAMGNTPADNIDDKQLMDEEAYLLAVNNGLKPDKSYIRHMYNIAIEQEFGLFKIISNELEKHINGAE